MIDTYSTCVRASALSSQAVNSCSEDYGIWDDILFLHSP